MLKDIASAVLIVLALLVICIGVVEGAGVLDFLEGLGGSLVRRGTSNPIWPIHSIQASRVDFIC